jgi:hypothetical protein
MKRLTEIGLKTGTDKATYHLFTEYYDDVFSKYDNPRILEIGVYNFSSIAMYLEYYKNPYIVGMDIENKSQYLSDKWKFVQGDQTKIEDLERCIKNEDPFDIILDDGGHTMKQQQVTFGFLIDHVKKGGYFILEDLHTSLNKDYLDSDCEFTTLDMLRRMKHGESYFSNYIPKQQQIKILSKIDFIEVLAKDADNLYDSVTCIIKIKS